MILDASSICGAIDNNLAELIHTIITIIKIGIPVLLIIFGMLDLAKGVIASKEDETKKGQHMFIKRLISAVLVFFVIAIVQLVIGLVDDKNEDDESDAWQCANLIMNGKLNNNNTNEKINNKKNKPKQVIYETSNGVQCYSEDTKTEYNVCLERNTSENNTNNIVCGTIFKDLCNYQGTILWNTNEQYNNDIVNEVDWYNMKDQETFKQVYYDCVQSGLPKEMCKGYFAGLYSER